jgi:3-deoxy-D-manno-octulosonic acid (KDO) 8-phosphate synthase
MSIASIAAGADGLLIEVHPNPDEALKDGAQSLTLEQFQRLMPQLHSVSTAIGRAVRCSSASRCSDRMTLFRHTMASLLA